MTTTYLLVGHGSRGPNGNVDTERFAQLWRQRHPERRIALCYIEYAETLLAAGLDQAAEGAQKVVLLPVILNTAGHVKQDLPQAVAAAKARHPAVEFVITPALGMGAAMFAVLQEALRGLQQELAQPDPQTTGVILLGRGSSDAGANGELAKMARWLFEANDHQLVDLAFTGVTWPRLESVVQRQVRLGMMQIAIVPAYLFSGVLIERIAAQVARLRAQYPQIHFVLSAPLGFAPGIFALLDQRAAQADAQAPGAPEINAPAQLCGGHSHHGHEHHHPHSQASSACAHHHSHS